jgi:glycosyltransferase involved in cell wall biosynthesis
MKLAIVVPRFGDGIVGGAETLARRVAGLLAEWHTVTVLTTTATDYETWSNDLPEGATSDGGVRVLRFPVPQPRGEYWTALDGILGGLMPAGAFSVLPAMRKRSFARQLQHWPFALQEEYVRWQGPYAPQLFAWLARHGAEQDRVLFFTYLYPTTYFGMRQLGGERIDFFPTLHDEPAAYLPVFGECFRRADRIFYSTQEEFRVAQRLFGTLPATQRVVGCGVAEPRRPTADAIATDPFLLYVGRIDVNKGVVDLVRQFLQWKEEQPRSRMRLLLTGEQHVELPQHPAIEYLGRVGEDRKVALMRQAVALVHPSPFESLGLVLLEAFWCGTPALVFGRNEVLVEHCRASNGGLWYRDYAELVAAVTWFEAHPEEAKQLGAQAREYVRREYGLDAYRKRLLASYPAG